MAVEPPHSSAPGVAVEEAPGASPAATEKD